MSDRPARAFAAIVLAAGGSSRMGGAPKQLLELGGSTLLAHTVDECLAGGADPVIVVLGASADKVLASIAGRKVIAVQNPDWVEGLSTSIGAGIGALLSKAPGVEAVLVTPCDQPALSSSIVARLAAAHFSTGKIACSRFAGRNASPAVFGCEHFGALHGLKGDQGARGLLSAGPGSVQPLELPELAVDFDTMADYEKWAARADPKGP